MKRRVLTALLLIPPVLLAVFLSSPLLFAAFAALAFAIGFFELVALGRPRFAFPTLAFVVAVVFAATRGRIDSPIPLLVGLSLLGAAGCERIARGVRGQVATELAAFWLAAPLLAMIEIKMSSATTRAFDFATPLLYFFLPLWIGDTAGILIGKKFGRRLLAPGISPGKTVEGAVANGLGCLATGLVLSLVLQQSWGLGLGTGLACATLGQAGDLLESAMKRSAAVKDSGRLLPGHGGLLDRIDSLLLSAPWVALAVSYLAIR